MEENPIPFSIKAISTPEFATIKSAYKDGGDVGISTGFKFGINSENHAIAVSLDLAFECGKVPFIILKVEMEFNVMPEAFNGFKNDETKKVTVPQNFLTHLAAMTVGTARGILHVKLGKTDFEHFLLPALNVSEILTEDMDFELN